jgi:hypothetical protein
MVAHRDVFDFKVVTYNGSQHLTFIIGNGPRSEKPPVPDDLQLGYMVNSAYQVYDKVDVNRGSTILDVHEFHVIDEGKTALMTTTKVQLRDVSAVGVSGLREKRVANKGFQEVDLTTGNINFEWDALENGISLTESYNVLELADPKHSYWDFLYVLSVFPLGAQLLTDENFLLTWTQSHQFRRQRRRRSLSDFSSLHQHHLQNLGHRWLDTVETRRRAIRFPTTGWFELYITAPCPASITE